MAFIPNEKLDGKSMFQGYGALPDPWDRRDFRAAGLTAPVSLPLEFILPDHYPVKNQNGFGSCTAQGYTHHKQFDEGVELSARFLYAKTKELEGNTSWGAYPRNAFKVGESIGTPREASYPEDHTIPESTYLNWNLIPQSLLQEAAQHKLKSYWRVESDPQSIGQTILKYQKPVVISVPWFASYNNPDADGFIRREVDWRVGHAFAVEGFKYFKGEPYLWCKNSWGPSWGKGGYFWFPPDGIIWDGWCSSDLPKDELPVLYRYGQPRTWTSYLREKSIAFNPWLIKKLGRLANNLEINALAYGFWPFEALQGKFKDEWLYIMYPEYMKRNP